jgi:predicted ribosome quality control (RQC) complex YloA/Tae2 family protein
MRVTVDVHKSIEQNAGFYYEQAKRFKHKVERAKLALKKSEAQLKELLERKKKQESKIIESGPKKPKEWFEKFRWFISSEGFLVIGGRDATTNEIVIKKNTANDDLVFHTDTPGSPFIVIKTDGKKPGDTTIQEAATATASFSRAWKLGVGSLEVFYVKPEQLSKAPKSGEFISKGSFMVYGKKNYITASLDVAIGMTDKGLIMAGPQSAVKKNCAKFVILELGKEKVSKVAQYIQKKIGGTIDDIIRVLPSGGVKAKD